MANKKAVHTVPSGNGWVNKQASNEISRHNTKANAEVAGRQRAKQSSTEHVIHNKNGQISEKNSYGKDPCPPKDKR